MTKCPICNKSVFHKKHLHCAFSGFLKKMEVKKLEAIEIPVDCFICGENETYAKLNNGAWVCFYHYNQAIEEKYIYKRSGAKKFGNDFIYSEPLKVTVGDNLVDQHCDVCSIIVTPEMEHLVRTQDIIESKEYWLWYFDKLKIMLKDTNLKRIGRMQNIMTFITSVVLSEDDWLICPSCIYMFDVDFKKAGEMARTKDFVSSPPPIKFTKAFAVIGEVLEEFQEWIEEK